VAAYADLGGLGTKQGPPVFYDWVAPSLMPELRPWLLILALLLFKPNRCASAWWIWAPLGFLIVATNMPQLVLGHLASSQFERYLDCLGVLGFGMAAVWLLSSYLGWRNRLLSLAGIGVFGSLACVLKQGWGGFDVVFFPGMCVLALSLSLTLAGLACRGRYGWLRVSLWLMAVVMVFWLVELGSRVWSRGDCPVLRFLWIVGMEAGLTFGALLPFLVLSFANGFYRERLKGLLHLGDAPPPPVITPPMPPSAQSAGS
jgi:hypothetical protein